MNLNKNELKRLVIDEITKRASLFTVDESDQEEIDKIIDELCDLSKKKYYFIK